MKIQASNVEVMEDAQRVFFVGKKVVTSKHLSLETLENINKYFVNQRVIYRHDDPLYDKGGAVYGRVVESTLNKEGEVSWLDIKALMSTDIDKQKELVKLAKKQQELGKPIRWSVSVWRPKQGEKEYKNEILELSLTNNPVVTESSTEVISMEEDEIKKLQEEFEKKIEFIAKLEADIKKFEGDAAEKDKKILELEKQADSKTKLVDEMKELVSKLEKANTDSNTRITALEKENEMAKKAPLITELYGLEHDDELKQEYNTWSLEKLNNRLVKQRAAAPKNVTSKVISQSMRESFELDPKDSAVIKEIKQKVSPELKKALGWA